MQAQSVMQDTPVVWVWTVPSLGVFGAIDQAVPFQDSASVAGDGPEEAAAWPTALQVVALKQDTPDSPWLNEAEVSGLGVMAHEVPLQVSIRFWFRGPANVPCPTAVQKLTPAQETLRSMLPVAVLGAGVVARVQFVPFQTSLKGDAVGRPCTSFTPTARHQVALTQLIPSASGMGVVAEEGGVAAAVSDKALPFHWLPKMVFALPMAVPSTWQMVVATHETDVRSASVVPVGSATVARVQAVPFHVSARGTDPVPPTARQKDGPTQETERSVSLLLAGASTLGTTLHVVPFQRSVSDPPPVPMFCPPTETQNEALVHEMLFNWFDPVPAAAWASVHCTALTVGGLVGFVAPAGAAPKVGTVRATIAPAVAIRSPIRTIVRSPLKAIHLDAKRSSSLPVFVPASAPLVAALAWRAAARARRARAGARPRNSGAACGTTLAVSRRYR